MKFPGVWFGFDSVKRKNGCVLKHTVRNAVLFIRFINDSLPSKIFPRSNHNSIEKLISKKRGYHLNKNETLYSFFSINMHQNYFRSNTEENHYRHLALFINCTWLIS